MLLASAVPALVANAQPADTPAKAPATAVTAPVPARSAVSARNCSAIRMEEPATVTLGKSVVIPLSSPMARILVSGHTPGSAQAGVPAAAAAAAATQTAVQ
ncbi:MAG: type II and III secretion system protein family protein, partial [Comamonas sp.]